MIKDLKHCRGCGQDKPRKEFNKNKARTDGLQNQCRSCNNKASASHYERNKESYVERAGRRNKEQKRTIQALKEVPCMDCGGTFPPCAMDFDHRPEEEKLFGVASMSWRRSIEVVMAEVAKCDVVCACCHRIRTADRLRN